jgi:hypothetical protein
MRVKGFGLLSSMLFFVILLGPAAAHAYLVCESYADSAGVNVPDGKSIEFHFDLMRAGPANPSSPWVFRDATGASGHYTDGALDIQFLGTGFDGRTRTARIGLEIGSEPVWLGTYGFMTGESMIRLNLASVPDLLSLLEQTPEATLTIYNSSGWERTFSVQGTELSVEASPIPIPPTLLLLAPCLAGLVVARRRVTRAHSEVR